MADVRFIQILRAHLARAPDAGGAADVVNELTVFAAVRAASRQAAAESFKARPHSTTFPCDSVDRRAPAAPRGGCR